MSDIAAPTRTAVVALSCAGLWRLSKRASVRWHVAEGVSNVHLTMPFKTVAANDVAVAFLIKTHCRRFFSRAIATGLSIRCSSPPRCPQCGTRVGSGCTAASQSQSSHGRLGQRACCSGWGRLRAYNKSMSTRTPVRKLPTRSATSRQHGAYSKTAPHPWLMTTMQQTHLSAHSPSAAGKRCHFVTSVPVRACSLPRSYAGVSAVKG